MERTPSAARKQPQPRFEPPEEPEESTPRVERARLQFATKLIDQATPKTLGRPPRTEEEKRQIFHALALYQSARLTYEECAERLGVSRTTVHNYLSDPLYKQMQQEMIEDTRRQGFISVGALAQDAVATLMNLLEANSEFVRYKAAEEILRVIGLEEPQKELQTDDRRDVSLFLEQIRSRNQRQGGTLNVDVHVHMDGQQPAAQPPVVDALPSPESWREADSEGSSLLSQLEREQLRTQQREMSEEYTSPLLPGGRLPGTGSPPEKRQI